MIDKTIRPSLQVDRRAVAIMMPTNVSSALTMVIKPVCRNVDSASTSVVILVMIRPDSSRS